MGVVSSNKFSDEYQPILKNTDEIELNNYLRVVVRLTNKPCNTKPVVHRSDNTVEVWARCRHMVSTDYNLHHSGACYFNLGNYPIKHRYIHKGIGYNLVRIITISDYNKYGIKLQEGILWVVIYGRQSWVVTVRNGLSRLNFGEGYQGEKVFGDLYDGF